ncbi:hypothetical protein M7784_04690 [Desulfovibrio aminophilus]|nr:hypothetical protein [Desulfovibrio aminophilus]MCM0754542.1 hypothetical protein [Desulfovibrio aminophilus]
MDLKPPHAVRSAAARHRPDPHQQRLRDQRERARLDLCREAHGWAEDWTLQAQ